MPEASRGAVRSYRRRYSPPPMRDDTQALLQEALAADRRLLFLLVGLPGSGKTTFAKRLAARLRPAMGVRILSTDYLIEKEARQQGTTYNELFDALIEPAEARYRRTLRRYLQSVPAIILDRTHLSIGARARATTLASQYDPDRLCIAVVMPASLSPTAWPATPSGPPAGPFRKPPSAPCTPISMKRPTRRASPTSSLPIRKPASRPPGRGVESRDALAGRDPSIAS